MTFIKLFTKLLTDGSHLQDKNVWYIQEPSFTVHAHHSEPGQMDGEELGSHEFDIHFESTQHDFWLPLPVSKN